ncbi:MAG: hypothetical protein DRP08_05255 [Candidatus Aenigmatarchaeota archaeon]|nr:MAG: hypothetical protein DRP08_05255 [Candidatus Aenigmarchaeota archaeon]
MNEGSDHIGPRNIEKRLTSESPSPSLESNSKKKLLLVGPLPPPNVGPTTAFKIFCDEVKRYPDIEIEIVDISAKHLKKKTNWFSPSTWAHSLRVIHQFFPAFLQKPDCVLIFCSYGFLLSMGPLLVGTAKMAGEPCFIRPFAGSLDEYYEGLSFPFKPLLAAVLGGVDGIFIQTTALYEYFKPLLGNRVYYVPNYRYISSSQSSEQVNYYVEDDKELELVYVGAIREDKGVFVLLDSLKMIAGNCKEAQISCDFYGPIHSEDERRFHNNISGVHNARYKGVLQPDHIIATMQRYDLLVLPTYHLGEGHPGVIIEAMAAGIPVITTNFRSIPDLVQDGENGLLIIPKDTTSLMQAIETVYHNRDLLRKMAEHSREKYDRYDVQHIVRHVLHWCGVID